MIEHLLVLTISMPLCFIVNELVNIRHQLKRIADNLERKGGVE